MVQTFKITDGGITFTNGSIDMVGTPNKIDPEEKLQSLAQRFKTQLGENNWVPDEGFDYEGIFGQLPISEDFRDITQEQIIKVNCIRTLAQDPEISKFIDKLDVELDEENHEAVVFLSCHTIEGDKIEGDIRLGLDLVV